MSVFSAKMKKAIKKATAWSLSALTALTCASSLPLLGNTTAQAASDTLSNESRGVLYANSRSDFRDETIYFLITTRFYDGDPSNNEHCVDDTKAKNPDSDPAWRGDFKGLIDKLDYIKALGFTAIWITPVVQNRSSYDYHGYHAYDFTAVDTRYESNGITYQDLIDACHSKGMKVIQDVVFNHSCNWGEKNLCPIEIDVWSPNGRSDMPMPAGKAMDPDQIYHHFAYAGGGDWDNYNVQITTLHSDCFDLNTENPKVYNYLIDCYKKFIDMGVDAFRVDTVKHLSRLTLNKTFVPALREEYRKVHSGSGYEDFYMFGEVCTKGESTWYRDQPPISTCFYTWADSDSWLNKWTSDPDTNIALTEEHYNAHSSTSNQPTSTNAFLNGNDYHAPDYSQRSGLDSIDFQMHWQFDSAGAAFGMAKAEDPYFNDSTWNVTYVNSHDYSPNNIQTIIPNFSAETWAEDLSLIFTFRGIPCIYYGTEIQFQAGKVIDKGPECPLSETGRAYFGDNIEGTIQATDFTVFNATGKAKETLDAPLSQHLMRLNRIRMAVPALRKGQYSVEGVEGGLAFKRRYTDANTDSFCCVTISGGATFNGIPNGTYVDAVTGDTQNVTGGTLTANCSGQGNLRVYVLNTAKTPAPGRVVPNGAFMGDGGAATIIGGESVHIVDVTSVTLDQTNVSVLEGESVSVKATVKPDNASDKSVSWSTSDASVATVAGGNIKGVAPGTATITAKTANNLTAKVTVTVKQNTNIVRPTGVTVSPSTLSLESGATGTLTATVTPSNATDKSVTWSSSNTSVATVANGTITAVGAGTATITATTSNGKTATATVTVTGKSVTYIENGVYFEKPSGWGSSINVYMYDSATDSTIGAAWPGTAMKADGNGVYYYEYKPTTSTVKVIFNDGANQIPGAKMPGFDFQNRGYYTSAGFDHTVEKQTVVEVTSISLDKTTATVNKDSTVTLTATVNPSNATNKAVTWTSSNTSVATVSNGVVTGVAEGTATITASSSNGKTASATITVKGTTVVTALTNNSTLSSSTIGVGDSVTLNGAASGGTAPYEYAYYYKKQSASSYTTIKAYSTTASVTLTPSTTIPIVYDIRIKVRDADGTVKTQDMTLTVKNGGDSMPLTNKSTIASTTISLGNAATIKCAATGGTAPYTYAAYYKKSSSSSFTKIRDYSTNTTITVTPAAATNYTIRVKLKDSKGSVVNKDFNLKVTPGVLTNKSTVSATSITAGSKLTITGKATGGTSPYEYAAYYKKSTASSYTLARGYNSTSTITIKPAEAATYNVRVKVRDNEGTVVNKDFKVVVKPAALANTSKLSASSVTLGSKVTISGSATGGTSPYQYAAYYKKSSSSSYTKIRDYKTTATMSFTPAAAATYDVRVKVKDSTGTVVNKDLTVKVTSGSLANTSKVSATTITLGKKITITGAATGGTAPYSYAAYYKKASSSSFTQIRDYGTTATMTVTPAAATTYTIRVKVKDKTGKVVSKDFTVKVNN